MSEGATATTTAPCSPQPITMDRRTGSGVASVYTALSNAISARHRQEAAPQQVPSRQASPPPPSAKSQPLFDKHSSPEL